MKDFLGLLAVVGGLGKDLDGLKGELGDIKKGGDVGGEGQRLLLAVGTGSSMGDALQDFAPLGEGAQVVLRHG